MSGVFLAESTCMAGRPELRGARGEEHRIRRELRRSTGSQFQPRHTESELRGGGSRNLI